MAMPMGVQAVIDDAFDNDAASSHSAHDSDVPVDIHRERFERYVPPHERGHSFEAGDQAVNFRERNPSRGPDPDRVEGADNDKFQRLKLNVNFAIGFDLIKKVLRPQFPGVFFHCSGNNNHDHPVSHVVTQIGTRFLQRKIHPGAVILDVFGNPKACERFNRSQAEARDPKVATALVHKYGPSDFIREINKWGPIDGVNGPRFVDMSLKAALDAGVCDHYDTFTSYHTMYYMEMGDILRMLLTPSDMGRKKRFLALVHRHDGNKGSINNGEQEYEVKPHLRFPNGGLIKQRNMKTNSVYVHPNLTPMLFGERKEWFPSVQQGSRVQAERGGGEYGLAWECHYVNEDTWIIEMVVCDDSHVGNTFADMWDDDKMLADEDPFESVASSVTAVDRTWADRFEWLPAIGGIDKDFVRLDLVSKPLFERLRVSVAGKPRNAKAFNDLLKEAKHLTNPSALFGDKDPMRCPPEKVVDHAIAAFLVDFEKEGKLMDGIVKLKPLLRKHAEGLKHGSSYKDFSFGSLLDVLRSSLVMARSINGVVRHKDPVEAGLGLATGWLEPA